MKLRHLACARSTCLAACFLACLAISGLERAKAQEPTPMSDEVIDLDAFQVKGRRALPDIKLRWLLKPKPWQYAQMGEFEVLSNAWQGDANKLLQDFQKFRDALSIAWPMPLRPIAETTIVICGAENKFAEFTTTQGKERNAVFSHLFRDREKATIVIDTQKGFYDARIQNDFVRLEIDPRRILYREYAHLLYSQVDSPPPPWLIEGNTQIIMDTYIFGNIIRFGYYDAKRGTPSPADIPDSAALVEVEAFEGFGASEEPEADAGAAPVSDDSEVTFEETGIEEGTTVTIDSVLPYWTADPAFHIALANQKLMTMEEMFSVTSEQYQNINPLVDLAWAKQAHAFVHYCKFGADRKYEQAFQTFVTRIAKEPLSEALFTECFDMPYDAMLAKLSGYIRSPYYKSDYIKLYKDQGLTAEKVVFRNATPNEIGRIVGNAQFMAGKHEQAMATYEDAIEQMATLTDEPDRELLATMGIAKLKEGKSDEALTHLEAAVNLGSKTPSAWTSLARLRLDAAKRSLPADAKLEPKQMATILLPLLQSRKLTPPIPATYDIMAEAWEYSAIPPNLTQIDLISEGIVRFQRDTKLALRIARLYAQAQDIEQARKCAEIGLRYSTDEFTRTQFENFLSQLPVAPTPLPQAAG